MSRDADEDMIEATIRKVAASKAAGRAQPAGGDADPEPEPSAAATNLIDATIRRIAASKAAGIAHEADTADAAEARAGDSDPFEATIRRIAASAASRAEDAAIDSHSNGASDNEDPIEATIRRVAAESAARAQEAANDDVKAWPSGVPDLHIVPPTEQAEREYAITAERPPVDESLIEATLRRLETEQAARATAEAASPTPVATDDVEPWTKVQAPQEQMASSAPFDAPSNDAGWAAVADALRRDLDETQQKLRVLTERVESLLGVSTAPQLLRPTPASALAAKTQPADDEWDDAPQLPRIPLGSPPRPAIVRDPSPRTATAAQLEYREPEPAYEAPAPAPVAEVEPPAAAPVEAKRGFDLLPRTYRITVEDKRRGVDLVPLHRGLLGMDGVRDMSLLSYSNGTAIVALETTNELDPDMLGKAVAHAMAREVKVEVHNEQTMVIKLAED